jgi:hypothetical protein
MPEPDPPATLSHQVLADLTGRRRRRLAIAGRVGTAVLGLWLVVLILGGLGLQPLAGLPIVGHLGVREAAPPALPERVQAAVIRGGGVAPTRQVAPAPAGTVVVPLRRPTVTTLSGAKPRPPAQTTPAGVPKGTKTIPGRALTSPALAPSPTTTSPSSTATGQTQTPPGQTQTQPDQTQTQPGQTQTGTNPSSTAPGQTRTAPGQTKTGTGPPTTTPGTTPGANGKAYGAGGTVTTP